MLANVRCANLVVAERLEGAIGRWADVTVHEHARSIMMTLNVCTGARPGDAWHYARSLRLEIALGHPASCRVDGRSRRGSVRSYAGWDLESGDAFAEGPFKDVFWWIGFELWNPDFVDESPLGTHSELEEWRLQHSHSAHKRMEEICELTARRAVGLCDQAARATAMRFEADARFFVYAALLSDSSGRVRQMSDVCPGVLTLAAACDPCGTHAQDVLEGIRAGRKLTELIDLVLPTASEAYNVTSAGSPLARSAAALVRRAPPMSLDDTLHLLHAPGLDINDAPHDVDLETWCDTMARWARHARRLKDRHTAKQLGGFFSKHALALDRSSSSIEEILDWVERSGAPVPTRRSSPARIERLIEEWHATLHVDIDYDMDTTLAEGPVASRPVPGLDVVAIRTVGQLVKEGLDMRHCVASGASLAVAGAVFYYRAEIEGARITIAIAGSRDHWRLQEAAGVANRRLDARELATIQRWVEGLR